MQAIDVAISVQASRIIKMERTYSTVTDTRRSPNMGAWSWLHFGTQSSNMHCRCCQLMPHQPRPPPSFFFSSASYPTLSHDCRGKFSPPPKIILKTSSLPAGTRAHTTPSFPTPIRDPSRQCDSPATLPTVWLHASGSPQIPLPSLPSRSGRVSHGALQEHEQQGAGRRQAPKAFQGPQVWHSVRPSDPGHPALRAIADQHPGRTRTSPTKP